MSGRGEGQGEGRGEGRAGTRLPRSIRTGLLAAAAVLLLCAAAGALSLDEVLSLALERGGDLGLQKSAVARSSLALREARAELGPRLTLSGAGAYLTNPPSISIAAGSLGELGPPILPVTVRFPEEDVEFSEISGNTYFELSLELEQPLFTWLKLKNAVDLAALAVEVSAVELEEARRRVRREAAEGYYAALLARESRVILAEMAAVLAEVEADRREAYELGAINLQDVLDVRARAAEVAQSRLAAEEGLLTALAALSFYTGVTVDAAALSSDFAAAGAPLEESVLERRALARSPGLDKARLQVEQARRNAARARGAGILRPDLALSLSLDVTGQKLPWSEEGWGDSWDANLTIGLGAEGSLFDSGRSHWRAAQAEEALRGAEEAADLGIRQLRLAVRRAIQEARIARGRVGAARAVLRARSEAEANARLAFGEEMVSREQLGLARLERLRGELELLQARHAAAVADLRLEYLAGDSPAEP